MDEWVLIYKKLKCVLFCVLKKKRGKLREKNTMCINFTINTIQCVSILQSIQYNVYQFYNQYNTMCINFTINTIDGERVYKWVWDMEYRVVIYKKLKRVLYGII